MLHLLGERAANQALRPEGLSVKVYGRAVSLQRTTLCLGILKHASSAFMGARVGYGGGRDGGSHPR